MAAAWERQRIVSAKMSRLVGAARAKCQTLYLGGISLESTQQDILQYCSDRKVVVTDVYMIRTHVWGTQSAKLFVTEQSVDKVLSETFWPSQIRCRSWKASPPGGAKASTS